MPLSRKKASNAASLTGFQQSVGINEFNADSLQGPLIILGLTIAGSLLALIANATEPLS